MNCFYFLFIDKSPSTDGGRDSACRIRTLGKVILFIMQDIMMNARLLQKNIRQYISQLEKEDMDVTEWSGTQADIARRTHELTALKTSSDEEEAEVCIAALMSGGVTIRDQKYTDRMVKRALKVLKRLRAPALRCRLLVVCFGETFDEKLAEEARMILDRWPEGEPAGLKVSLTELLRTLEEDMALTMGYHMT